MAQPSEAAAREPLLEVRNLHTWFHTRHGIAKAVDGIDFQVAPGEVLCLVGESGCGKSVTAMSVMRLVSPPGRVEDGEVLFDGENLLTMSKTQMAVMRGEKMSMIFQDPTSSLNPVAEVGLQISEVFEIHRRTARKAGRKRAVEMLERVGIPDPGRRATAYPHEMSGGMAQRVMIAMALACEPRLLIADEPTSALDVTIQAQILDLMRNLQSESGMAIILITHDLGVVAEMADRVAVMYSGEIVEETDVATLFREPLHPYTESLLGSIPTLGRLQDKLAVVEHISDRVAVMYLGRIVEVTDRDTLYRDPRHPYTQALLSAVPVPGAIGRRERLVLQGDVPSPLNPPSGCRFHPRCPIAAPVCAAEPPELRPTDGNGDHQASCHLRTGDYRDLDRAIF